MLQHTVSAVRNGQISTGTNYISHLEVSRMLLSFCSYNFGFRGKQNNGIDSGTSGIISSVETVLLFAYITSKRIQPTCLQTLTPGSGSRNVY